MRPEITLLTAPSPASLPLEIVERKGVGHPDTICDALAEHLSVALSRIYLERFGVVQHHNVDKGLLWGGAARPAFGGGEMCAPIELHLGGRATVAVRDERLPVEELAVKSNRAWLRVNLRFLDPDRHVRIIPRIHATSAELAALFARQSEAGVPLANDTSFGVGFAPLDELERIVLAVERRLNAVTVKQAHPEIGEDVKVMGARRGRAGAPLGGIDAAMAATLASRGFGEAFLRPVFHGVGIEHEEAPIPAGTPSSTARRQSTGWRPA